MAKDTEKLIRQLSLISYLMAERRPVTALEIRRDVGEAPLASASDSAVPSNNDAMSLVFMVLPSC